MVEWDRVDRREEGREEDWLSDFAGEIAETWSELRGKVSFGDGWRLEGSVD